MLPIRRRAPPQSLPLSAIPGADVQRSAELLLFAAIRGILERRHISGSGRRKSRSRQALFFPGNVQDYHEIMTRHPANYQWENWSLENVATVLAHRFPNSYVWVIKVLPNAFAQIQLP
ncbi:mitochondrial protein C2orf69-like [Pongo pygmaeus]|uniref:mitochondrial protein C2orf69-like n=1 Tax=Pongo pygmaeus TaxID=9600 RepID=UPI0023E22CB6|nr:mitochondrial protein C2orf69-like [Pongo pygmaeus]